MTATFLDFSARKLTQLEERIEATVSKLTYQQLWWRGGGEQNAIGNLILHLSGNVRQWIIHGVGGEPDIRQRDLEFSAREGAGAAELLTTLRATVRQAGAIIEKLNEQDLSRPLNVQNYDLTVLEGIYHVVEHFSGHTGQIIYAAKLLTSAGFDFYNHLDSSAPHGQTTP